jgi:hypothetical protein
MAPGELLLLGCGDFTVAGGANAILDEASANISDEAAANILDET